MTPRDQYIGYFRDLAMRHADIAHDPNDATKCRFYLELDYNNILGWTEPNNKGWNLVLMGYETNGWDNKHGRKVEKVTCVFDILKYAKAEDPAAQQAIYNQARDIGEELLVRFAEHTKNPCNADVSAGVVVPYAVDFQNKQTIEVGPRWNNYFGYRFSVNVLMDAYVKTASDPDKWLTL